VPNPPTPWRPLGQILVEQGLLTEEDLATVLVEQKRSGRKLGELVVERGLISWPALTKALAKQYGLELQIENGFPFGLRIEIERRHGDRRAGVDRRLPHDRRSGTRRQSDSEHVEQTSLEDDSPDPVEYAVSAEELETFSASLANGNGRQELEVLRGAHHAWLADLTEKFKEQHGYLASAAAKIEEHEATLEELRRANAALKSEIEQLRMRVEEPEEIPAASGSKPAGPRHKQSR
jgi:hypothetical protein